MSLDAKKLDEKYRDFLHSLDCASPYLLHKACHERRPKIDVTYAAVRTWWDKYRIVTTASVSTAKDLEDKHGEQLRLLAADNRTGYKLRQALGKLVPPIVVTEGICKQWLSNYYGPLQEIESAGRLQVLYGQRLRTEFHNSQKLLSQFTGPEIAEALLYKWNVLVPASICQHWLSNDWSSSGYLLTAEQVEGQLGDRLRLNEYKHFFG